MFCTGTVKQTVLLDHSQRQRQVRGQPKARTKYGEGFRVLLNVSGEAGDTVQLEQESSIRVCRHSGDKEMGVKLKVISGYIGCLGSA